MSFMSARMGVNWGSPVAAGTFANDATNKSALRSTTGQYCDYGPERGQRNPWTRWLKLQLLNMTSGTE